MANKIKIGITHGDINGVGYEVIMKTLSDSRILDLFTPVVYGSAKAAAYHKKVVEVGGFTFNQINSASDANPKRANILNCCDDNLRVEIGKKSAIAGEAAYSALEKAVADLRNGEIDALVTAPINKDNIQSDKFNFPGHTEYLAEVFDTPQHLMLLVADSLRVGVVVGHAPISDIPKMLTSDIIVDKLRILQNSLVADFGITNPRIAVLGLNPHAGDNGLLGTEEIEVIQPALKTANDEGITALGPFAADGFFGSGQHYKFDAVLAMYHDQGLAPFKALTFDSGVNFTAGLPVVRTSPGHGTALDIAGKGIASEESLRSAIYAALDIFRNRMTYYDAKKNPLQKYEIKSSRGETDHVNLMDSTNDEPELY